MADRENFGSGAVIKVIGVGGGGNNAINTMIESGLSGVEFIAANTDIQALQSSRAAIKIQLGRELTKGLGAGACPDTGRDAALEDKAIIQEVLNGADMVFITAGMGGGTGTGAAPIIAQVARELGALTVGVVTKPFQFEGKRRKMYSDLGIQALRGAVDTLITIPNQRLLSIAPPTMSMLEGFKLADEVLLNAVKGISDIINIPGRVNVDFADVKTIMSEMGMALMGVGSATGSNRAAEAARAAINSPLLEDIDIEGATGILINITGSSAMTLHEISEASTLIQEAAHEDANIIFGAVIDDSLGDNIRVTVIATGFDQAEIAYPESKQQPFNTQQNNVMPGFQNPNAPHALFGNNQPNNRPAQGFGMQNTGNPYDVRSQPQHGMPSHNGMNQNRPNTTTNNQQSPFGSNRTSVFENNTNKPAANNTSNHEDHSFARRSATMPATQQSRMGMTSNGAEQTNANRNAEAPRANEAPTTSAAGNKSRTEFEELTQWTLDLAKTNPASAPQAQQDVERSGASASAAQESARNDTEAALNIARELSNIQIDDQYETPAFLRRKEESTSKNQ